MRRYSSTRQKIDKSGIRVYSTTYYPEIPISDSDRFIRPVDGDRIDNIAYREYGDVTLWWIIAKANGLKGKPALSAGDVIRIPSNIINIIEKFNNLNNGD